MGKGNVLSGQHAPISHQYNVFYLVLLLELKHGLFKGVAFKHIALIYFVANRLFVFIDQ